MNVLITPHISLSPLNLDLLLSSVESQAQGRSTTVNIPFTGPISPRQVEGLRRSLVQVSGPLQRIPRLAFHLGAQHDNVLHALLQYTPENGQTCTIFYSEPEQRVTIRVTMQRAQFGEIHKSVKVTAPLDANFAALEAGLFHHPGMLSAFDNLEILVPLSTNASSPSDPCVTDRINVFFAKYCRGLKKLTIHTAEPAMVISILNFAARYCQLSVLRLTAGVDRPLEVMGHAIHQGLSDFAHFPKIIISGTFFTFDLFLKLGELNIRELYFDSEILQAFLPDYIHTPRSNGHRKPSRFERFCNLKSFALTATLNVVLDLCAIMAPMPSVTNLVMILPTLPMSLAPAALHRQLATTFPRLELLHFEVQHPNKDETPEWLDFQNLSNHRYLTSLSIVHPYPLVISNHDFKRILATWPLLTHLNLNPRPKFPVWPGHASALTWNVLTGAVRRSGMLKSLALYLGAQPDPCPPPQWEHGPGVDKNRVLEELLVGTHGYMHPDSFTMLAAIFRKARVANTAR